MAEAGVKIRIMLIKHYSVLLLVVSILSYFTNQLDMSTTDT